MCCGRICRPLSRGGRRQAREVLPAAQHDAGRPREVGRRRESRGGHGLPQRPRREGRRGCGGVHVRCTCAASSRVALARWHYAASLRWHRALCHVWSDSGGAVHLPVAALACLACCVSLLKLPSRTSSPSTRAPSWPLAPMSPPCLSRNTSARPSTSLSAEIRVRSASPLARHMEMYR